MVQGFRSLLVGPSQFSDRSAAGGLEALWRCVGKPMCQILSEGGNLFLIQSKQVQVVASSSHKKTVREIWGLRSRRERVRFLERRGVEGGMKSSC